MSVMQHAGAPAVMVVLFIALSSILGGSAHSAQDVPLPAQLLSEKMRDVAGVLRICSNHYGQQEIFEYLDVPQVNQDIFSVWVMKGVFTGDVRLAYGAQVDRTHSGVNLHLTYDFASAGDRAAHMELALDVAISGGCGELVGTPVAGDGFQFDVAIDFTGMNVVHTNAQGKQESISVSATVGAKFTLNPKGYPSVSVSATTTTTTSYWEETSTSVQGFWVPWAQDDYSSSRSDVARLIYEHGRQFYREDGDFSEHYPADEIDDFMQKVVDCAFALEGHVLHGDENALFEDCLVLS